MDDDNEIAIVGVGCRFPGADNADEFWLVLVNGENHVNEINNDRWNHDAFYSDNKDDVGKYYVKRAGLLKNHDEWDHRLFGVSESEAVRIDPQQRYVLGCTHMAMEDGGITRADLKDSLTGIFIDTFQKQTSQGWDHKVHVVMTKDTTNGQLLLGWGKEKKSRHKSLRLNLVREAHVKRINALYVILIKLPKRMIGLKTWSRVHATDWLNTFMSEKENYTAGNGMRL